MRSVSERLRPAFFQVLRWRYVLLFAWLLVAAGRKPFEGLDWSWLNYGSELLFGGDFSCPPDSPSCAPTPIADGPGGLHTFATEPRLHMGPLSLVAAAIVKTVYPGDGRLGAMLFMCTLGPAVIFVVERAAVRARGLRDAMEEPLLALTTLVSGAAFLFMWADVTWSWGRLDEFLVICAAAAAIWLAVNGNPLLAGIAVGLGIGAKSWGVFLIPLLAALPWRQALRAATVALVVAAAVWLPFVIADFGTIDAARALGVQIIPGSGAHAVGFELGPAPDWLRTVQAALALGLAAFAVMRGRWGAALLLAVGARLALDPSPIGYYAAALVFAALVWDLLGSRRPFPIWGLATFVAFHVVPRVFDDPEVGGVARIAIVAAAITVVLGAPKAWLRPLPAPSA